VLAHKTRLLRRLRKKTLATEIFPADLGNLQDAVPEISLTEHQHVIRSLLKILDEAIVPASILIAAKVIGLVFVNFLGNYSYTIQTGYSALPWTVVYSSPTEALAANDYSNLFMYSIVLVGFSWILIKAHFLHDTHLPPRFAGKLARLKLWSFVQTTFEIYHQAVVWLSFLWLTTLVIFIYTLAGGSAVVFLIPLALSSAATFLYTKDVEVEIKTDQVLREAV
jgi:hypothetical protein